MSSTQFEGPHFLAFRSGEGSSAKWVYIGDYYLYSSRATKNECVKDVTECTPSLATTSSSNSGRTQRGSMNNEVLFTVESFDLKWTDISIEDVHKILDVIGNQNQFAFYHPCVWRGHWVEASNFYAANFSFGTLRLNAELKGYARSGYPDIRNLYQVEQTKLTEFSFQVTSIDPMGPEHGDTNDNPG